MSCSKPSHWAFRGGAGCRRRERSALARRHGLGSSRCRRQAPCRRVLFCLTDASWAAEAGIKAPRFVRERFGIAAMLESHARSLWVE